MTRAAYDPETISMLSTVLERAIAALPPRQRTEDGKARLASSIVAAAPHVSDDGLATFLQLHMLDTDSLGAAVPQAP